MFTFSDIFSRSNDEPLPIAAVDLGSNSFHMIIAQWQQGQLTVLDRLKESVRLGWGLSADGNLDDASRVRAMQCLERFGERLRELPAGSVRVVGTKTLRSIRDSSEFLRDAESRLGHSVEIISGEEEARLIYLGVGQCLQPKSGNRVLVDIGGGSTEVIVGQQMALNFKESLSMGCVALTRRYFSDNRVTGLELAQAHIHCMQEIRPVRSDFEKEVVIGSVELMGASGTIKAVSKVCIAEGWSRGEITRDSLIKIKQRYLDVGDLSAEFLGLSKERQPVFLGGVCVLDAVFDGFAFDSIQPQGMTVSPWALREGLLYDLKGRLENTDVRDASINAMAQRFHVDEELGEAVQQTARLLLQQVRGAWLPLGPETEKFLLWAAKVYAVGLEIRHSDYHKHSAYMVENTDIAGFSRSEQQELAALVLAHRKRFPQKKFPMANVLLLRLAVLLRLSVLFHRGRKQEGMPELKFMANRDELTLQLSDGWLQANPLTEADLLIEKQRLLEVGLTLNIS